MIVDKQQTKKAIIALYKEDPNISLKFSDILISIGHIYSGYISTAIEELIKDNYLLSTRAVDSRIMYFSLNKDRSKKIIKLKFKLYERT